IEKLKETVESNEKVIEGLNKEWIEERNKKNEEIAELQRTLAEVRKEVNNDIEIAVSEEKAEIAYLEAEIKKFQEANEK
ncbi:14021_t:CDS:1, partial [Cetraspora pellucida]